MTEDTEFENLTEIEKYKTKKIENKRISDLYKELSELYSMESCERKVYAKKSTEIKDCGSYLSEYIRLSDGEKQYKAYFCKNRFCPLCTYKVSKMTFKLVMDIVNHSKLANCSYIFLTLTVKNCKDTELSSTIDLLQHAYNKLITNKQQQFAKRFLGTFKVLESTYNSRTKEYHPHFHILAIVDKTYYKDVTKYLTKDTLIDIWQKALGVDYKPSVDVRATYNDDCKTVAEVSKYAVKSSEIVNSRVLQVYDSAFHKRRLKSFSGLFKEVRNEVIADWKKEKADCFEYKYLCGNKDIIKNLYKWDLFRNEYRLSKSDKNFESAKLDERKVINDIVDQIDFDNLPF